MGLYLPQEIANLVAQNLNSIAVELYEDETIDTKFVFYGTSDFAIYERFIKGEYEIDDEQKITPFILSSISGAQEAENYIRYEEQFNIGFYGFVSEKRDFEILMREYVNRENTSNRVTQIDTYRVEKSTGFISIENRVLNAQDGTNQDRFYASFDFIWSFASGIMTSEDIQIFIDTVEIPYNIFSFMPTKRTINSQEVTSAGIDLYMATVQDYAINFNLPYLTTNAKLVSLFQDIFNKKYNKKYLLKITIGTGSTGIIFEDYVTMVSGSFIDTKPVILDFEIIFKRVAKQTQIQINDYLVPVLDFSLTSKAEVSTTNKLNEDEAKSAYLGNNYVINMSLPLDENDSNSIIATLLQKVIEKDFNDTFEIKIIRNSINKTYNALLVDGTYKFDIDSNGSIELMFIEAEDD